MYAMNLFVNCKKVSTIVPGAGGRAAAAGQEEKGCVPSTGVGRDYRRCDRCSTSIHGTEGRLSSIIYSCRFQDMSSATNFSVGGWPARGSVGAPPFFAGV